jgi:hypothetical protein
MAVAHHNTLITGISLMLSDYFNFLGSAYPLKSNHPKSINHAYANRNAFTAQQRYFNSIPFVSYCSPIFDDDGHYRVNCSNHLSMVWI